MHLVVNTLSVTPNRGGVKTYITNLVGAILETGKTRRMTLLCSRLNKDMFRKAVVEDQRVDIEVLPLDVDSPPVRILYDQIAVPLLCKDFKDAVLLSQANVSSLALPLPEVVVIQSAMSVRSIRRMIPASADTTSWCQRVYYDTMLPLTLSRADQVVAVSKYLRGKLVKSFPKYASKIRTVYEGVSADVFTPNGMMKNEKTTESPYLLFVGTLFPYKRADQAIRAFAHALERTDARNLQLKLAGRDPGNEGDRLERIARTNGVADQVELLGSVAHHRMPKLYREAQALLFPSMVETFGLPVLEAMASGTPVIASNRMSVPEVVGEAGLIVDARDTVELANAICRVIDDKALRARLKAAGIVRAEKFKWERTADGVLEAARDARRASMR